MAGAFKGVHLELHSTIDVLDRVQEVAEDVCRNVGLDEDKVHWTSMAVRECVINAITHGNKSDAAKLVSVDFTVQTRGSERNLVVTVADQGNGFDPTALRDPLSPENILST